jgi:hypothetical protein
MTDLQSTEEYIEGLENEIWEKDILLEAMVSAGKLLEDKVEQQKRIIDAQDEYIKFLGDYIGKTAEFLRIHHQGCPDEIVEKGKELREKIKQLKGENHVR